MARGMRALKSASGHSARPSFSSSAALRCSRVTVIVDAEEDLPGGEGGWGCALSSFLPPPPTKSMRPADAKSALIKPLALIKLLLLLREQARKERFCREWL